MPGVCRERFLLERAANRIDPTLAEIVRKASEHDDVEYEKVREQRTRCANRALVLTQNLCGNFVVAAGFTRDLLGVHASQTFGIVLLCQEPQCGRRSEAFKASGLSENVRTIVAIAHVTDLRRVSRASVAHDAAQYEADAEAGAAREVRQALYAGVGSPSPFGERARGSIMMDADRQGTVRSQPLEQRKILKGKMRRGEHDAAVRVERAPDRHADRFCFGRLHRTKSLNDPGVKPLCTERCFGRKTSPRRDAAALVAADNRAGRTADVDADQLHLDDNSMIAHTEYLTMKTSKRYEILDITDEVERFRERAKLRDGLILVSAMHITASVFVNDHESGLWKDIMKWLEELAPRKPDYMHHQTGEDNADAHLKRMLLGHQVVVPVTEGKLDFGPWERVHYGEFDGQRPKRILLKALGI